METSEKLKKERSSIKCTYSLLVHNISYRTTPDDLFRLFDKYGKVVDIFIPRSQRTGKSRGYAFVGYHYPHEAQRAVNVLNGKEVDGREIGVKFADHRPNRDNMLNYHTSRFITPLPKRTYLAKQSEIGVKFADHGLNRDKMPNYHTSRFITSLPKRIYSAKQSEKEKRASFIERSKRTPRSSRGMLTLKERTSVHMGMYMPMANKALDYYNSKKHTNMKLVEVCVAFENDKGVHINFRATSDSASHNLLFFAELKNYDDYMFSVEGCCVLEQVDFGNPLGRGCRLCTGEVIHPGPSDGYRIVSGDRFEGYNFWDYRPCAYDESKMSCSPLPEDWQMFRACATKALEYFNLQQRVEFRDVKVFAGVDQIDNIYEVERKIHINFTAKSRSSKERELFFAELIVPLFAYELSSWEKYKEDFIQVKGCCKLKQIDSGNPFGRMCGLCCGRVKHPGPTYGYCVEAGDQFKDAEFWNIGLGIY